MGRKAILAGQPVEGRRVLVVQDVGEAVVGEHDHGDVVVVRHPVAGAAHAVAALAPVAALAGAEPAVAIAAGIASPPNSAAADSTARIRIVSTVRIERPF